MSKDEKIIMALGFLAVAAIILYVQRPDTDAPPTEAEIDAEYIPVSYLTYNQPYMFAPPVANILPPAASGILGQAFEKAKSVFSNDCGCF